MNRALTGINYFTLGWYKNVFEGKVGKGLGVGAYPRWALIQGERLSGVGAYSGVCSRWALIRGGRLFEVGAYSRWALIRGGRLFK